MAGARSDRVRGASAPRPLRLFVAVDLPDDARDAVAEVVTPLRDAIAGARWSDRAAWHVTLKFLGPTPPELVDDVSAAIAGGTARVAPFASRLDGLGAFPGRGPARVLWVGLDDPDGRLADLARAIDTSLTPWFESDARSLHPHVTVARLNPARRLPEAFGAATVRPAAIPVDRVRLYRSHLGGGAPRYERLATVPLGGS